MKFIVNLDMQVPLGLSKNFNITLLERAALHHFPIGLYFRPPLFAMFIITLMTCLLFGNFANIKVFDAKQYPERLEFSL